MTTTLIPPGTEPAPMPPADPAPVGSPADAVPPAAAPPAPPPVDPPGGGAGDGGPAGTSSPPRSASIRRALPALSTYVPAVALQILAAVLLGFVVHVVLLSQIQHDRDQQTAYADFRGVLAHGIAPVGQLAPPELEPPVNPIDAVDVVEPPPQLMAMGTPVAVLQIPSLGLTEVVFEGTTSDVLRSGPGHRRDSVLPGQAGASVIMGRQTTYGGPFARLHTVAPGELFTVTTGQGRHTYRILGVRREGDPLPPPMEPGAGRLVLVTADGRPLMPSGVLYVDTELVTDPQPAPPKVIGVGALTPPEQVMAGDTGALYPLVLWGQAVLLAVVGIVWARQRWGRWQAWVAGIPILVALGMTTADQVARLLPNLV